MRKTISDVEYYVERYNNLTGKDIVLCRRNGSYHLEYKNGAAYVIPYGMTIRECYYVMLALFNMTCE